MELPTGTIIDDSYRILERISLGREVDVYRVEPLTPGPAMMIHMLRTALLEGDPGLEIFENAGLELCRFSHDAFPEVVDYGRFMVRPFVVTELAEGSSLAELLEQDAIRSDQALHALETVREAVHAAHRAGMLHCALSAESILMTPQGKLQIPDLGARWIAAMLKARGEPLDPSADLHALVNLSQTLMRKAKRRPAPPPPLAFDADLELDDVPAPATIRPMTRPPEQPAAPVAVPEPTVAVSQPSAAPTVAVRLPEPAVAVASQLDAPEPVAAPAPTVAVRLPEPTVVASRPATPAPVAAPQQTPAVRLPPPPMPPPAPVFARTATPPPAPAAVIARTPPPVAAPVFAQPVRAAPPRFDSFAEEPMMGAAALQPSYVTFFREMFSPGVGSTPHRAAGPIEPAYVSFFRRMFPERSPLHGEDDAKRFLNLAMVCSAALIMLAAVLHL